MLQGTEVKSLRDGKAQLKDAYAASATARCGCTTCTSRPTRRRRARTTSPSARASCCMHKREIERLIGKTQREGADARADAHLLQGPAREGRDRAGAGQGRRRQAPGDQGARDEARDGAGGPEPVRVLDRVREVCLALPETSERLSHGQPTFFVGKKTFVMYLDNHHDDGRLALWCAAPAGMQEALVAGEPEHYFRPPYVGHRGWVGVRLDRAARLQRDRRRDRGRLLRVIAPKRLVDSLHAVVSTALPPTCRSSSALSDASGSHRLPVRPICGSSRPAASSRRGTRGRGPRSRGTRARGTCAGRRGAGRRGCRSW